MGLFSGIKKAVSSVASTAKSLFGSVKDVAESPLGKIGIEGLGTFYGLPGLGSVVGSVLGGDYASAANSALDMYRSYQQGELSSKQFDQVQQQSRADIEYQNMMARQISAEANAMSQSNAREQMNFQQYMSNTAHQREVQDLRNAGLNPILSGTGGMGASSPAGAQGSVVSAPVVGASSSMSTAAEVMRAFAETSKINAVADLTRASTDTERMRPANVEMDTALKRSQSIAAAVYARTNEVQRRRIFAEIRNLNAMLPNIPKTGRLTDAQAAQVRATTANLKEQFKTLKMRGDIDASEYGELMEMAKRATDVIGIQDLIKVFDAFKRFKK